MQSYTTHGPFTIVHKHHRFSGVIGKHSELASGTLYFKDRPLISVTGDLHDLVNFDAVSAINTHNELVQLIGIYYHGDLYPLTRKPLMDTLMQVLHQGLPRGRSYRLNIYNLKWIDLGDASPCVKYDDASLFIYHHTPQIGRTLATPQLGKDHRYLRVQANVVREVLEKQKKKNIVYNKRVSLVGKNPNQLVLAE